MISTRRRFTCDGRETTDWTTVPRGSCVDDQAALFRVALPAPNGDASIKGEVKKARPTTIWLSGRGQRISAPSGRNQRIKKTNKTKIATWNVRSMLDSIETPRRRMALIEIELEKVNAGIATL